MWCYYQIGQGFFNDISNMMFRSISLRSYSCYNIYDGAGLFISFSSLFSINNVCVG